MNIDFEIKAGDTEEPLTTRLTESGVDVDLTNADSVEFRMVGYETDTEVAGAADILNATEGSVAYAWADGDTDTPGMYFMEWEVTWADGDTQRFPSDSYDILYINPTV